VAETSWELREKAKRYRSFTRWVGDSETTARILAFTDELDHRAMLMERPTDAEIRPRSRALGEGRKTPGQRRGILASGRE
jgi:hypothetical protein